MPQVPLLIHTLPVGPDQLWGRRHWL